MGTYVIVYVLCDLTTNLKLQYDHFHLKKKKDEEHEAY